MSLWDPLIRKEQMMSLGLHRHIPRDESICKVQQEIIGSAYRPREDSLINTCMWEEDDTSSLITQFNDSKTRHPMKTGECIA